MSSVRTLWTRARQSVSSASSRRSRASSRASDSAGTSPSASLHGSPYESPATSPEPYRQASPSAEPSKHPLHSADELELARVGHLQNSPVQAPKSSSRAMLEPLRRMGLLQQAERPARGPAYVRMDALAQLGYTPTAKRSAHIMQSLARIGVTDRHGLLVRKPLRMDSLISLASADLDFHHGQGLSASEQRGLTLYVQGVQRNIDMRARSLEALPEHERPLFMFYTSMMPSAHLSRNVMIDLQRYGVLDGHMLPRQGGQAFETYRQALLRSPMMLEHFEQHYDWSENVRDRLFALPNYSEANDRPPSYAKATER